MPGPQVPDTSVLIPLLRDRKRRSEFLSYMTSHQVRLSAVVVAELLAGSRSNEDTELIQTTAMHFREAQRLLTPTFEDWLRAGEQLQRYSERYGRAEPRAHIADALIVASVARVKGTVVTHNVVHMTNWASLIMGARVLDAATIIPPS